MLAVEGRWGMTTRFFWVALCFFGWSCDGDRSAGGSEGEGEGESEGEEGEEGDCPDECGVYAGDGSCLDAPAECVSGSWQVQSLESVPSLRIDNVSIATTDVVRVLYSLWYDPGLGECCETLRLAETRTDAPCAIEEVAEARTNSSSSIAVDGVGVVHVVGFTRSDLIYMRRAPDEPWTTEIFENEAAALCDIVQGGASIALDTDGGVHVGHTTLCGVAYAYRSFDGWSRETIDKLDEPPQIVTVAVAAGIVHAAYYDNGVKYARRELDNWTIELVEPDDAYTPSLVADTEGNAHLAYAGETGLRYAVRGADGTWSLETVDSSGYYSEPSLALNAMGSPRIAYGVDDKKFVGPDDALWYAMRNEGGTWDLGTTGESVAVAGLALVVDDADVMHIGYVDSYMTNTIRHAWLCP